jgi:hypothetical protein
MGKRSRLTRKVLVTTRRREAPIELTEDFQGMWSAQGTNNNLRAQRWL